MSPLQGSPDDNQTPTLEMAYVLFMDIVGYSRRSLPEQSALVAELQDLVRSSGEFARAEAYLRRARSEATRNLQRDDFFGVLKADADDELAGALVNEAKIHFARGSFPLAKDRTDEALDVQPGNREAQELSARIDAALGTTTYDRLANSAAYDRIRARRDAIMPRPVVTPNR